MDSVTGSFTSCGLGVAASFQFTCSGPDCDILSTFPNVTCQHSGSSTVCSNGIHCSSPSSYSSNFTMSQVGELISIQKTVDLGDCGAYNVATNGSVYDNSTSVTRQPNGKCKANNPSASQSTGASSSSGSPSRSEAVYASSKPKIVVVAMYILILIGVFSNPVWALEHTENGNGIENLLPRQASSNFDQLSHPKVKSTALVVRDDSQNNEQNPWLTEALALAGWFTANADTKQGADLKDQYEQTIIAGAKSIACNAFYSRQPNKLLHWDVFDTMCMTFVTAVSLPGGPVTAWVFRLLGTKLCDLVISQTIGQLEAAKDVNKLIAAICDNIAPPPDPINICVYCLTHPKLLKRGSTVDPGISGNLLKDPNNCGVCGNQV
jgi:hypothetical protein